MKKEMVLELAPKTHKVREMILCKVKEPTTSTKQTSYQDEVIYVLQTGEYHRTRNIKVTSDVKAIAKEYVSQVTPEFNSPNVEVWKNGEVVGSFYEVEKNESKVKKALTKIAMGFQR